MKVIAIDTNERLHDSDRISYFHYYMFHGMWDAENLDSVDPQTGEKRRNLMRNARIVPPIVQIHNDLYVSERVKKKLEGVPGIRFVRANFTRLVDYPFAKGDFFFYKTPYFQAAERPLASEEFFDGFLRSLPDVPEYHRTIEPFYKLEATPHFVAEELDPKAPKMSCRMPKCTTESMRLRLSPRMMKASSPTTRSVFTLRKRSLESSAHGQSIRIKGESAPDIFGLEIRARKGMDRDGTRMVGMRQTPQNTRSPGMHL